MAEKDTDKQIAKLEKAAQALHDENTLLKVELKKIAMAHEEMMRSKQETIIDNVRLRNKLAEYEKEKVFVARAKRITAIANLMLEKAMISKDMYTQQVRELSEMDDKSLESWKKIVINTQSRVSASTLTSTDTSQKKAVANMNPIYISTDDESTMGKMTPPSLDNLISQLPWNTGIGNGP